MCLFSSSQSDIISYCSIHFFYHHVSQDLSIAQTEPVHPIDEEVEDANDLLLPENEEVDIDFDIQERVDEEQVEEQPTPLLRERLPTILEEPEEEEEEREAQPSPAVRRRRRKREVDSLLTDLGGYWSSPSPCGRRRSSRDRRKPQRYVP